MGKLTKRSIEALAPREIDYIAWDNDVPGFGVRVMPSGRKSFVLQYRAGRRSRRMVLGYVNVVTPEQARTMAIQHLAALRQGVDPLAERDGGRDAVTVKDLAARFDAEHIAVHLKPSTQKEYRRSLKKFILPFFGNRPIAEVSREEVARFHHKYRHVPYQANRCLEILSKMFNLAELWGLRPDGSNPRKHIKKYREEKRERFLSAAELRRVGEVLREMEAEGLELPSAIAAVMLLILTGCRLNEIMTLRWEYVDLGAGVLNLPDSKTGAKTVYLGTAGHRYPAAITSSARQSMGDLWHQARRPAHRLAAVLAAAPRPRRPQGRSHPRPAPHLCLGRRRGRPRSADDRQAARAHAGGDDGSLCPPRRGSGEGGGQCGGKSHFDCSQSMRRRQHSRVRFSITLFLGFRTRRKAYRHWEALIAARLVEKHALQQVLRESSAATSLQISTH